MTTAVQGRTAQQGKLIPSEYEENIVFPDLFISFQAQEPRLHPRYQEVKEKSESWIAEYVLRNEIVD